MITVNRNSLAFISAALFALVASGLAPIAANAAGPAAVNLGTAGNFAILSKTGISTTGTTAVAGDLGVSPAAATYITGFALNLPAAGAFSTSALVTGKIYASDYADPTPANLTTAVLDMQTAYTDAAGRAAGITEQGAGNIGGLTLAPGVYKWSTGPAIPTDVTLSGGADDIWIFQVAQNLNLSPAAKIILSGGAQSRNVFWVVAGQTTIGTTAVFNGNILDQTTIVLNTGAQLNGRALAQTAVTLDSNAVAAPGYANPLPATGAISTTAAPTVGATSQSQTFAESAPTADSVNQSLQSQVNSLNAAIQLLQAQRAAQSVSSSANFSSQIQGIAINLGMGSRNNDVMTLQRFLISQNKGPAAQTLAHAGATAYFGNLTRLALAEFQTQAGINPPSGLFGPVTRAYLRSIIINK